MEDEEEQVLEREEATFNSPISNFIDRLRHAYWHDDDQMEFDFPEIDEIEGRRGAVWIDLRIARMSSFPIGHLRTPDQATAGGKTEEFRTERTPRWSDGLRSSDRTRLAQALLMIRKEKKAMRLADAQAGMHLTGDDER